MEKPKFTNYETARILGARALQIAMDAPYLTKISKEKLEEFNYDPMEIAKIEFELGVLPITVKQPMPEKKSVKIKKVKEEPLKDKEAIAAEAEAEKDIVESGEIMELANPQDEDSEEEVVVNSRESSEELQ